MIHAASSAFNDIAHRPSDLLTYVGNSADPCASTQIHHLIPRELWNDSNGFLSKTHVRQILNMTGGMDSPMNLMELPSTVAGAAASNLALHNGSHSLAYTDAVRSGLKTVETLYLNSPWWCFIT